jgi:UDP-glucose:(heptosyl)LPS alpha-1,3-glucosyltransferase
VKLLVVVRPYAFHGGIERATAALVEALREHGHAIELLVPGGGVRPAPAGVPVRRLRMPPLPSAARALALVAAVRLVLRSRRWDVVQSHERTLGQDVYRAGEGCHRAYLAAAGRTGRRALHHRVTLALERRVFATTPHVVAIAQAGAREIAAFYGVPPARLSVVYNGVDLVRFHPDRRAEWRAGALDEVGVPRDTWLALFVGSGFARKGLATALRGFAGLGDRSARLVVVGRGDRAPYARLAQNLGIAQRVVWLGPRPDVERWYASADVVALPSRYEPFGNVHLEALASGVPVVASARAGGAEVVADGCGAVIDPDDAGALAQALSRLREGDRAGQARAARAAAEPYTYARQVAAFERIYRSARASR